MTKTEAFIQVIKGYENQLVLTEPARITNHKADGKTTRFVGGFIKNLRDTVVVEVMVYADNWINFKAFSSSDRRVKATREDTIQKAQAKLAEYLA